MPIQGASKTGIISLPIGGGIVADEVSQELADNVCTDGNNVRFRDGYVRKTEGYVSALTTPSIVPYHVANLQNRDATYWVHVGLSAAYSDDGLVKSNITGSALTGTLTQKITSCVLGGVLVINTQADVPQYWAGSGTLTALPGWDLTHRCASLRSFKNYLIALNVTKDGANFGSLVMWSDVAAPGEIPGEWAASDINDAGDLDVAETDDQVVDGLALGNTFVVYKQRSCYGMQYLQNNSIFRVFKLPGGFGALSQNCVADTPNGHVVLTNGPDVILHYANEPKSIIQGRWRAWLSENIDQTNYVNSFVVTNRDKSEVWVCVPTTGSVYPNVALIWNWNDDTWAKISIPNLTHAHFGSYAQGDIAFNAESVLTFADWTETFDSIDVSTRLVASSANTKLYLMDEGDTADGSNFTATFSRVGLSFGDADTRKLHCGLTPRVDAEAGTVLSIEGAYADDAEGPYSYKSAVTYTVGTTRKADFFASGRFVGFRVTSTGAGQWRIKSVGHDIKAQGPF